MMNIKMKKTLTIAMICAAIVICLIVATICIWVYVVLPIGEKYRSDGAVELALDYYEFDEVLFVSWVSRLNNLIVDNKRLVDGVYSFYDEFSDYYYYVLGIKEGEEVAVLVPRLRAEKHCKTDWIFDVSFCEISEKLNNKKTGSEFASKYDNIIIKNQLWDIETVIPDFNAYNPDICCALICGDNAVIQVNGEAVVIGINNK